MAEHTKVTRIKATTTKPKKASPAKPKGRARTLLGRIGGYFKGAWAELKEVRWPTRAATWQLTLAVILFTVFFLVLVTSLDILFKFLFEQLIA